MASPLLVFVSGLGGFDRIGTAGRTIGYFRGLEPLLQRLGIAAHFPAQRPFAGVAERAEFLAGQLAALPHPEIHLVAHSMGGLDSRLVASQLDPQRRVRAVVTVATPHRGTPLAQWLLESPGVAPRLFRVTMRHALRDLTVTACERLNRDAPDRADVRYFSYGGVRPEAEMSPLFRPWVRRIAATAGDNDSQVPLSSALWGTFKQVVRADHFELSGWSVGRRDPATQRPFDHLGFYRQVIAQLAADTRPA